MHYLVAIDIMTSQGMYSIVVGGSWNKVFVLYGSVLLYTGAGRRVRTHGTV